MSKSINAAPIIAAIAKRAAKLPGALAVLRTEVSAIEKRMATLEKQGLIYATLHMRNKKYLLLVYPQKNGLRPPAEYIGTNADKIAKAKAGVDRAKEFDQLKTAHNAYTRQLAEALSAIQALESLLAQRRGRNTTVNSMIVEQ